MGLDLEIYSISKKHKIKIKELVNHYNDNIEFMYNNDIDFADFIENDIGKDFSVQDYFTKSVGWGIINYLQSNNMTVSMDLIQEIPENIITEIKLLPEKPFEIRGNSIHFIWANG